MTSNDLDVIAGMNSNIQKSKKSALTEATSTCQKANEIVFILKWDKNTKALNELIKTYEDGIKDLV